MRKHIYINPNATKYSIFKRIFEGVLYKNGTDINTAVNIVSMSLEIAFSPLKNSASVNAANIINIE